MPNPYADFRLLKSSVVRAREYLPGVVKEREVHVVPHLPSILDIEEQVAGVAEPVLSKAADRVGPPHGLHQVEWDCAAVLTHCMRGASVQRENPIPVPKGDVRLDITNDTREIVGVRVTVVIPFRGQCEPDPDRGDDALVTEVDRHTAAVDEKVVLGAESRRRRGVKTIIETYPTRPCRCLAR